MWAALILLVVAAALAIAVTAWLNTEMRSRGLSRSRRIVTIVLMIVAFPVGFVVWIFDRDNNPGAPITTSIPPSSAPGEAPRWRDTLATTANIRRGLGEREASLALGSPITSPCSLRGSGDGLPKRWQTGHLRIGEDRLRWWRHLSRRRNPVEIAVEQVKVVSCRPVRPLESLLLSARCTVVSCELPDGGAVEFAFRYTTDLEAFLGEMGASSAPGDRELLSPWPVAATQGVVMAAVLGGLGLALGDAESFVLAVPAGVAVLVLQGRALGRPRQP